ncbi:unnamed protein product [Adineta steineri]|uniref:Glycine amidinotransferase n=1 Tax=Adineta steineri TaxID=433720 RepID=A0A816B8S5_9BILA|nr:unnamed protein product [Adineta steineri]CAF1605172.1 unnamed protein product [Adineta steineri]
MSETIPIVNSWTEWGQLELICVGSTQGMCYPDYDYVAPHNEVLDESLRNYVTSFVGPRPAHRIQMAQQQLENLSNILEGESVQVKSVQEMDKDINLLLERKRTFLQTDANEKGNKVLQKQRIEVCRSPADGKRFDHFIQTPYFQSHFQLGMSCPRDMLITLGNTIVEAPTACHTRYFEASYYRDMIYPLYTKDKRVKWLSPPKPTCSKAMFDDADVWEKTSMSTFKNNFALNGYKTSLNEKELAFDAADLIRMGKDVIFKKSVSTNYKGVDWLRRTFGGDGPEGLRFHVMHFPTSPDLHLDSTLIPLRPPTAGSEGLVLINQNRPPLANELQLFLNNDWKPIWCPLPVINKASPVANCSPNLNMNFLSLNERSCIIEECELPLYHFLDDLGFDVITCPLRVLNEFGGGIHCVTWDIRRNDSCKDYFPNQDYDQECNRNMDNAFDQPLYQDNVPNPINFAKDSIRATQKSQDKN